MYLQTGENYMLYIIEGQDATGKSTQAELLKKYLEAKSHTVHTYSESGTDSDNADTKAIAEANYGHHSELEGRTHALLYLANRYEQWAKIAEPALRAGEDVILTRNWFSTLIYEGYGMGVSKNTIIRIHKEIMPAHYFQPDHIVILTLSDEERAKRLTAQGGRSKENFKSQNREFQDKLNHAYLHVAKDFKVATMDAAGTPDEVFANLKKLWNI